MTDAQIIAAMRENDIADPKATLREAREAGIPIAVACALLEQESGGGKNVFGHDPVQNPVKGGEVTKDRYLQYKRYRDAGWGMQGVGPCQLTWYAFQDRADALGGCWDPTINMQVGFSVVRSHIRERGLRAGLARYNGGGAAAQTYAEQVLRRVTRWQNVLGAATAPRTNGSTPARTTAVKPTGPYTSDFVALCLKQKGDRYIFGVEAKYSDPNPSAFDCSELVEWALHRLGSKFPDGSWAQEAACRAAGTLIPIERAIRVQGSLLFRHRGSHGHVAVSLGNGSTIEARGKMYGVNVFNATGRDWTAAGLVPGLKYKRPPEPGQQPVPAWPGRYLSQPPPMHGADALAWQRQMRRRTWRVPLSGVYDGASERACRAFQQEKGLLVDGIVGPDTWRAAWLAPIT
jgi:cell wall-associated NlpC family hydrolase